MKIKPEKINVVLQSYLVGVEQEAQKQLRCLSGDSKAKEYELILWTKDMPVDEMSFLTRL
jgi:hypothetical protein